MHRQIASSVEKRIARALPVFRIDRLASVSPNRSASSVRVIRRWWSRSSSFTAIATSHCPFEVVAHERAFGEHSGQQEREEDGEPAVDRKARIETDRMRRSRNGLADGADDEAEKLQREQRLALARGLELHGKPSRRRVASSAAQCIDSALAPENQMNFTEFFSRSRVRVSGVIGRQAGDPRVAMGHFWHEGDVDSAHVCTTC